MALKPLIALFVIVFFMLPPVSAQKASPIIIATYNIRQNNPVDGLNAWPHRKENVKALIRFHEFDILGTQEGKTDQLRDLSEMEEFARIGRGRIEGKEEGEHSAIFYRKARFQLLDAGDFWLSETPDEPGLGWDATCCNRICSWGKFRDRSTKKTFYFFNVHFDHQGVVARRESGKLMVKKIQEIAKNTPVICTGDFNSTPEEEQIQTMETLLSDSYKISLTPPYGPEGTFNAFKFDAPMKDRIDYIFLSKDFQALKYGTLTDAKNQRYPSDHQPVMIKAVFR